MKVRFDDITNEGLYIRFSGDENVLAEALATVSLSPGMSVDPSVEGHMQFLIDGETLFALGSIHGRTVLQCSRCLAEFTQDSDLEIHAAIRRGPQPLDDGSKDAGNEDAFFFDGSDFDPGEIILQEILLALPMKPLCSEECPGLCPLCGALKGSAECTCPTGDTVDPRWGPLVKLSKEPSTGSRGSSGT